MFQTLGPSFMLDTCGDFDWFIDFASLNLSIYVAYYHQNMVASLEFQLSAGNVSS